MAGTEEANLARRPINVLSPTFIMIPLAVPTSGSDTKIYSYTINYFSLEISSIIDLPCTTLVEKNAKFLLSNLKSFIV